MIDAGPDQTLPCGVSCTDLVATSLETGLTDNYTVSSIPYVPPYPFSGSGTQLFIGIDDIYSSALALPFNFCFYGNSYNQAIVGTNGVLTFDATQAG